MKANLPHHRKIKKALDHLANFCNNGDAGKGIEKMAINETQETIDLAYGQGKAAYIRAIGTHGPTVKPRPFFHIPNPYPIGTLCREAWQRGYNQDTRRVIAGITKPLIKANRR